MELKFRRLKNGKIRLFLDGRKHDLTVKQIDIRPIVTDRLRNGKEVVYKEVVITFQSIGFYFREGAK